MTNVARNLLIAAIHSLARAHPRLYRFIHTSLLHDQVAKVCEPGNETVVVLAPHMDDEVLGCGGTMARHVRAGAKVIVVFLTDGRYPHAYLDRPPADREHLHREVIARRKLEAARAGDVLGVRERHFLDANPTSFDSDRSVAMALRVILQEIRPSIVYLPSFLERHPDHRTTGAVLDRATAATDLDFECRAYEDGPPSFRIAWFASTSRWM